MNKFKLHYLILSSNKYMHGEKSILDNKIMIFLILAKTTFANTKKMLHITSILIKRLMREIYMNMLKM